MKKILLSLLTVSAVAAVAFAGTRAFFSDTETSTGNTFTAGSVDLKVDSQAHYNGLICNIGGLWAVEAGAQQPTDAYLLSLIGDPCLNSWTATDLGVTNRFFELADLKPGDSGENTISLQVVNNDAYMCAAITKTDEENAFAEPETKALDTDADGELGQYLKFLWWADNNGDNKLGVGETPLFGGPVLLNDMFSQANAGVLELTLADTRPLNVFTGTGPIIGNATNHIGVAWCFGTMTLNPSDPRGYSCTGAGDQQDAMTDKVTADITFTAVQARNNGSYQCPETARLYPRP